MLSTSETVRAEEIVIEVPDGRSVTALLNATPIRSEEGEVESVVVTIQDMTPLERMERLRAEFLGMVSHELRTPLTSIRGSAIALLDATSELDPAEMRQFLRIIVDQTDNMRDLIGDLLDVARIETGTLPVSPEPADIAALVDRARNTFLSTGGRNRLDIDLAPDLPLVLADKRRIVQVIGNLLSNAARHSPESSTVRVAAVREGVYVEVSVADEGRGIPAERLPHLFRKFSHVEADGQEDDTGLGLAICKGIVEAHEGRIRGESDGPGLGARFTFSVPAVEGAAAEQNRIAELCHQFRLPTIGAESVSRFIAAGHGDALFTFLEVLEQEAENRRQRRTDRLRKESRLPAGKTWETFEHERHRTAPSDRPRARGRRRQRGSPSSWWTTILRRSGTSGKRSPRQATTP